MTDDDTVVQDVQQLVMRLSRPTPGGGHVIERAAILAEGSHFHEIEAWILAHGGKGEAIPPAVGRGLLSDRVASRPSPPPVRYLLPAGALG
jgi:hypothetical protein